MPLETEIESAVRRDKVIRGIHAERDRQQQLLDEGEIRFNCASPNIDDGERLAVLMEEVGEVARAFMDGTRYDAYEELVQVAAVACACAEGVLTEMGS